MFIYFITFYEKSIYFNKNFLLIMDKKLGTMTFYLKTKRIMSFFTTRLTFIIFSICFFVISGFQCGNDFVHQ